MPDNGQSRLADGSLDFSGGVDGGRVTTLKSELNPNGLSRNQLAWLENGSVRGGGISPRNGWEKVCRISATPQLWGGGHMYDPPGEGFPWLVIVVGGQLYEVRLDIDNSVRHVAWPVANMPNKNRYNFAQGEEFLVIQANDGIRRPIFYYPVMPFTGAMTVRQSLGIVGPADPTNELPRGSVLDYYQGRMWYAQGRNYAAGDIVGSQASGTAAYGYRDSILHLTENPLAAGGDGFIIPAQDGNIRALKHTSNINTQLGEGQLYIFTRSNIYSITVPVTRQLWVAATDTNQPLQTIVQQRYGTTGDRSVVSANGDLFYRTMEPGVRSLALAVRYANQWGQTPISNNVDRMLAFDDRALLRDATGMAFDNRLWETCLPVTIPGVGVGFKAAVILDFDLISSLEDKLQKGAVPTWEGAYDGLDILQLFTGDFGGRERAFAVVYSRADGGIDLWELTNAERRDNGDSRINWYLETPSYTWGQEFSLKELNGAEIWVDELSGKVNFQAFYRPDQYGCWIPWISWDDCAARGPQELVNAPPLSSYPAQTFCDQYRAPYVLPVPPKICIPGTNRPSNLGYQFQMRLEIKGWCRLRGLLLYALPRIRAPFADKFVCATP